MTDYSLLLRQRLITPAEGRRAQRGKGLNAAAGPIEGYRTGGSVVEKACVGDVREVVRSSRRSVPQCDSEGYPGVWKYLIVVHAQALYQSQRVQ